LRDSIKARLRWATRRARHNGSAVEVRQHEHGSRAGAPGALQAARGADRPQRRGVLRGVAHRLLHALHVLHADRLVSRQARRASLGSARARLRRCRHARAPHPPQPCIKGYTVVSRKSCQTAWRRPLRCRPGLGHKGCCLHCTLVCAGHQATRACLEGTGAPSVRPLAACKMQVRTCMRCADCS